MKTASVRELRSEFPKVMAWVDAGEDVVITKRRKVVARLSPATDSSKQKSPLPDFRKRQQEIYGDHEVSAEAMAEIVDFNKGRY